jgi:hypothetical protein
MNLRVAGQYKSGLVIVKRKFGLITLPASSPLADSSGLDAQRLTPPPPPEVSGLAITIHYSQCPGGRAPLDAGLSLAYNGNMNVYSQYFPSPFVGLAGKAGGRIINLCKP